MPKSVFEGFTVGVALSIGAGQLKSALGLPAHEGDWLEKPIANLSNLSHAQWGSMVLFFPMAIALYILCQRVPKVPWMTVIPVFTIALCLRDGLVTPGLVVGPLATKGFLTALLEAREGVAWAELWQFQALSNWPLPRQADQDQ